jgi:hypothetical protein
MRVHNRTPWLRNHQLIFTGYMNYLVRACYCEAKDSLYIIEIRVCYLLHNNLHTGGNGSLCIDVEGLDTNPQLEQGNMSFGSYGH